MGSNASIHFARQDLAGAPLTLVTQNTACGAFILPLATTIAPEWPSSFVACMRQVPTYSLLSGALATCGTAAVATSLNPLSLVVRDVHHVLAHTLSARATRPSLGVRQSWSFPRRRPHRLGARRLIRIHCSAPSLRPMSRACQAGVLMSSRLLHRISISVMVSCRRLGS